MDILGNRIRRVVESVLDNEGLAGGLDESAAEMLQQWAIANVTRIAEHTLEMDDHAAEQVMYPKLRAARRLARAVRVWLQREADSAPEEKARLWGKVAARAQDLYGAEIILPDAGRFTGANPAEFIQNLRDWLEAQK